MAESPRENTRPSILISAASPQFAPARSRMSVAGDTLLKPSVHDGNAPPFGAGSPRRRSQRPNARRASVHENASCRLFDGLDNDASPRMPRLACGAPPHNVENGWQMQCEKLKERIGNLFNSSTMSDVFFHVGARKIPAHRFVLASASPVFHTRLSARVRAGAAGDRCGRLSVVSDYSGDEAPVDERGSPTPDAGFAGQGHIGLAGLGSGAQLRHRIRVDPERFSFEAMFEFLRFVYTDDVAITLGNVLNLVLLADDFKMPCLSDKCLAFLQREVRSDTVFKILAIVHGLMKKVILSTWKSAVERVKLIEMYKQLSAEERRARRLAGSRAGGSQSSSCNGSQRSSVYSASSFGGRSGRGSIWGGESSASRCSFSSAVSGTESQSVRRRESEGKSKRGDDGTKAHTHAFKESFRLYSQITVLSEELSRKCWQIIREQTHEVISCADWPDQTLTMVRRVLGQEICSVPEIALFRALRIWAESECMRQCLPLLPEHYRAVVGEDTLKLLRFPVMSLSELQWEVVPTGMLSYAEVRVLLQIAAFGFSEGMPTYSGEARQRSLTDLVLMARKKDVNASEALLKRGIDFMPPRSLYTPAEDDEVDALLGSCLLRNYVDRTVEEQRDVGHAEALGHPARYDGSLPAFAAVDTVSEAATPARKRPAANIGSAMRPQLLKGVYDFLRPKPAEYANSPMLLAMQEVLPSTSKQPGSRASTPWSPSPASDSPLPWQLERPPSAMDFERLSKGVYRLHTPVSGPPPADGRPATATVGTMMRIRVEAGEAVVVPNDDGEPPMGTVCPPEAWGCFREATRTPEKPQGPRPRVPLRAFLSSRASTPCQD